MDYHNEQMVKWRHRLGIVIAPWWTLTHRPAEWLVDRRKASRAKRGTDLPGYPHLDIIVPLATMAWLLNVARDVVEAMNDRHPFWTGLNAILGLLVLASIITLCGMMSLGAQEDSPPKTANPLVRWYVYRWATLITVLTWLYVLPRIAMWVLGYADIADKLIVIENLVALTAIVVAMDDGWRKEKVEAHAPSPGWLG